MSISRREFTLGATSLVALTVLGCSDENAPGQGANAQDLGRKKPKKPPLPKEIFTVGSPDQYRNPGVYDQFNKTHRLWLVSNGSKLVALVDVCTHLGCEVEWFSETNLFECPCHSSQFDAQGTNLEGGKAERPLERYAISLIDAPADVPADTSNASGKLVQIDPTIRLRKDRDEWGDPKASIDLPKAKPLQDITQPE